MIGCCRDCRRCVSRVRSHVQVFVVVRAAALVTERGFGNCGG